VLRCVTRHCRCRSTMTCAAPAPNPSVHSSTACSTGCAPFADFTCSGAPDTPVQAFCPRHHAPGRLTLWEGVALLTCGEFTLTITGVPGLFVELETGALKCAAHQRNTSFLSRPLHQPAHGGSVAEECLQT
jgi:hypothetical protein